MAMWDDSLSDKQTCRLFLPVCQTADRPLNACEEGEKELSKELNYHQVEPENYAPNLAAEMASKESNILRMKATPSGI
ncbi:hypothetical protein TNCV_3016531 [Trichonephila clavipes]|nr:hypothetical protein TNCV_3016531 [Trichonephila clavipes]